MSRKNKKQNKGIMAKVASLEDRLFYRLDYIWPVKRVLHKGIMAIAHAVFPRFRDTILAEGPGAIKEVGPFIKEQGYKKALIMTDATLVKIGLASKLTDSLDAAGIGYVIYDQVVPDPTIQNVEEGYALYKKENCDIIIGLGGGSPMDAAKVVSGRVVRPNRTTDNLGGLFAVTLPNLGWALKKPKNYPKIICIPTTSGTGAETTFSCVITNPGTGRKYTVNDLCVMPDYVILDPELTLGVPAKMTAYTGIDALSHLTEAYVGDGHNKESDEISREGIKLVFDWLDKAVEEPDNIEARTAMMKAAHLGGKELIAGVTTYVHPFAHKTGALTHITHGYCIGTYLPIFLEFYRPKADKRLAELADVIGVGQGLKTKDKAEAFIQAIRDMCTKYGIDGHIPEVAEFDTKDFIRSIRTEAFAYPVPKQISNRQIKKILKQVAGKK